MEKDLFAEFDKLRTAPGAVVKQKVIDGAIGARSDLLPEQCEAAQQLLTSKSAIRVLTGVAGSGKSYTLDVVREAFERAGYRVIGGALAAVAKEELATKAGIEARTVASYLYHFKKPLRERFRERVRHDAKQLLRALQGKETFRHTKLMLDKNTVLFVDEAGMLDTRTVRDLCRIARKKGATIIFVGDTAQLQPIDAGSPFRNLLGKLSAASLSTNLRQRDDTDRRAAAELREGNAKNALQNFADRGRITVAKDRGEAIHKLVDSWQAGGGCSRPADHVIFTPTRAEARLANRYCQAERDSQGAIDRSRSLRHGDEVLCVGDRVLFHKNSFADGVRNGYRGVITQVDRFRGRLTIALDGGGKAREVSIRLRDFGVEGITLGYAQTTHKGQGQSVDHSYLLVGGKMACREMIYVQATRGKLSTQLFVDEAHAGEDLKDLARALARSQPKELAHDQAARAERRPTLSL